MSDKQLVDRDLFVLAFQCGAAWAKMLPDQGLNIEAERKQRAEEIFDLYWSGVKETNNGNLG